MINQPRVYIIILNWNGLEDTLECLGSIFKIDYPNFHVIVVDNGSTDNSVEVVEKIYPQVTLLKSEDNLGYTGGNNIAMKYAMEHGADYVWLLNNDSVVETDTLYKLVNEAEKSPQMGLVSPVVYYYNEPDKIQFIGSYIDWKNSTIVYPESKNFYIHSDFTTGKNVCLWGTSLLIKKNIIQEIGYLNEKYFAYWEDTEYSTRVLKAGGQNILCLSAKIYHKTPPAIPGSVKKGEHYFYYMTRNWYFWATNYIKSMQKLSFLGKYLSDILITVTHCYQNNTIGAANACLDGAWAAFCGISGPWNKNIIMPRLLKKVFLLFCSWHPYFWANLLQGNVSYLASETFKRIKSKMLKIHR